MAKVTDLNTYLASRLNPPKMRRGLLCCVAGLVSASSLSAVQGQSFLEKLESVVRDKINTPPPVPKPPKTLQASPQASPQAAGEELPAPNRPLQSGSAANPLEGAASSGRNSNDSMPSILEKNPSTVPAPRRKDELKLAPSVESPPAEPAEESAGVYLGMEVEELVGGGIGVRIASLTDNSPAWKAGFKVGDLLQAVDGHAIANIEDMADRLRRVVPGKPTKFLAKRAGRNVELVAVLQNAAIGSRLGTPTDAAGGPAYLGLTTSDLTPAFRTQFGLAVYSGAAVTNVAQGSPAFAAGILPGDAIVDINGAPIDGSDDMLRWLAQAQVGQPAELLVYRGTQPIAMSVVVAGDPRKTPRIERPRAAPRPSLNTAPEQPNASLQAEVEQLRADLEQTQQQLLETQRRLEQVLQQIEQDR